jgi:hypothetical protein
MARVYHHQAQREWAFTLQALREWKEAGHPVALSICQDRRAVRQRGRWKYFVDYMLREASTFTDEIEIGHAINRVKWGLWTMDEYSTLMRDAADIAADYPQARIIGPAVIDFEWHQLAAALDATPSDFRFSGLGHHLYVDRRGAPENLQGKLDLVGKLAVLKAFATHHPRCEDRVVISETNWPLEGTGVWSPVGSPYVSPGVRHNDPSVSEEDYARFMVRYLLLSIGSGMVDRVYWWKLAARGFGLVDPNEQPWRRRPAFDALACLLRAITGRTFRQRELREDGVQCLTFEKERHPDVLQIWWRNGEPVEVSPTVPVLAVNDLYGRSMDVRPTLAVGPSPLYVHVRTP